MTVVNTCLPNCGPGALKMREGGQKDSKVTVSFGMWFRFRFRFLLHFYSHLLPSVSFSKCVLLIISVFSLSM